MNKKGFTLIELLAVITIMGILMLVAIPAVSRTIENSRRDSFIDISKNYINAIRNAVTGDELECGTGMDAVSVGATPNGKYYFKIATKKGNAKYQQTVDMMERGGQSSWSNADVEGYVEWEKTNIVKTPKTNADGTYQTDADGTILYENTPGETTHTYYKILLVDTGKHGIQTSTDELALTRAKVQTATDTYAYATGEGATGAVTYPSTDYTECVLK